MVQYEIKFDYENITFFLDESFHVKMEENKTRHSAANSLK